MRQRMYEIINEAGYGDFASRRYDIFLVVISILSLFPLMFILERAVEPWATIVKVVDISTVFILFLDYIMRWMTHDIKTKKGWKAFLYYPFTPIALITFVSLLPSLSVLDESWRLLRVLRVVVLFRYSKNLVILTNAFKKEYKTLASIFFAALVYLFIVALIIYNYEPYTFSYFFQAFTWAATQLTAVSFSGILPQTDVGKFLSILTTLVALLIVALPAGVITGAYLSEINQVDKSRTSYYKIIESTSIKRFKRVNLKEYFANNQKVKRYIIIMASSTALSVVLGYGMEYIGSPVWVNQLGIALAAYLLEPAAGIIVGWASAGTLSFLWQEPGDLLLVYEYAICALVFGIMFRGIKDTVPKRRMRLTFLGLAIMTFGSTMVEFLMIRVAGTATLETVLADNAFLAWVASQPVIVQSGLPLTLSLVLADFGNLLFEYTILIVAYIIMVSIFGVKGAASEAEQDQQRAIILERALKEKNAEELENLHEARTALERKQRELEHQRAELEEQSTFVAERLQALTQAEALKSLDVEGNVIVPGAEEINKERA